ncbi:MAG: cysteine desulfurase [Lachnospiraceae bacterium]|nr:cysteine desulfurase [Lachnospiraceae bacterium]
MESYLDNAATTRALASVKDVMNQVLTEDYGNPSSLHIKGMQAENYIKDAKETIAKSLKADPKEIIFTSGGTESNNMALIGAALANRRSGNHIITTRFEHASVLNPVLFLQEMGFRVTFLPVDAEGHVILAELEEALTDDTILVSVMHVNNEIGAVQDIKTISGIVKAKNPEILFHVDAIQSYGKYTICPKREGIDLLSVSGHKLHGPKGSGFLYVRDKVKIKPILYGGGQQKGMRSGTENVPAIAGLAEAVRVYYTDHEEKVNHMYELKARLLKGLSELPGVHVNGLPADGDIRKTAPHIVNIGFEGVRSEVLLHALEEKGVYVSSGSACSSNHPALSGTLQAIGVEQAMLDSAIRFSFSVYTTDEEVDYAAEQVKALVPMLRRYRRK